MKNKLLLYITLLWSVGVFGQKGFDIGIDGTFNSTWILNQNNYGTLAPFATAVVKQSEMNYKPTWGWNAGISLGYNFTKNWGLKAELQYNQTGQKYEDNFVGPATIPEGTFGSGGTRVKVQRNVSLSYFQIPLMVKFTSNRAHVGKFFACFGPQIGFRTHASEQVKIAGYVYLPDSLAFTPGQKFQTFDLGLALQLGVDLYATNHLYFEVGLSAYGGLMDLNGKALRNLDWYSKNDVNYQKSYNFRAGLMVGVHYIIGKGRRDPAAARKT